MRGVMKSLLLALAVVVFGPAIAHADIPEADRNIIVAHSTNGTGLDGKRVIGVVAHDHQNTPACKSAYKAAGNKTDGSEEERLRFIRHQINILGASGPQSMSPNNACECRYNDNLVVIYNPTAANKGIAFCEASKTLARARCLYFSKGDTSNLSEYRCQ